MILGPLATISPTSLGGCSLPSSPTILTSTSGIGRPMEEVSLRSFFSLSSSVPTMTWSSGPNAVMVEAVSVCPKAFIKLTPGNRSMAFFITSNGIGAAPYVITLRLDRLYFLKSGWSTIRFNIVGTSIARFAFSFCTVCNHSSVSNCRINAVALPP